MSTLVCPITGLRLEYGEPVVSLLLTAKSPRITSQGPFDARSLWEPRTPPVRGDWDARWESSPTLDLWTEGLRTDAAPWSGQEGVRKPVGRRSALDDFLAASAVGRLFAREADYDWTSRVDPDVPTRARVQKALSETPDRNPLAVRNVLPSPVFPFVDVAICVESKSALRATWRRVETMAKGRCWTYETRWSAAKPYTCVVTLGPANPQRAVQNELRRRRERGERRKCPVALATYSLRGWRALLASPRRVDDVTLDMVRFRAVLGSLAARWKPDATKPSTDSTAAVFLRAYMRLLYASGDRGAVSREMKPLMYDSMLRSHTRLGLWWHLVRALDAGWNAETLGAFLDGLAELLAVDDAMNVLGRLWMPPRR